MRKGFTLIELLVVIAIIAILAVVVVLTLNPAQLLAQSRDANRVSDMATLNSALNLYITDQAGSSNFTLGNASSVYISLPDSSSTCGSWGLAALPTGYSYGCASKSNYKNASSTGWIPVTFQNISAGVPFGSLPTDPTNQSSSKLFYTYTTNGSQFELTAAVESQKQKAALTGNTNPFALESGSNLSLAPFDPSSNFGYDPLYLLSNIPNSTSSGTFGDWTFSTWSGFQHALITASRPDGSTGPVLLITNNGAVGSEDFFDGGWANTPVGGTYTFSFWGLGTGTIQLNTQWGGTIATVTLTPVWQRYSATFIKTGSAAQYNFFRATGISTTAEFWLAQTE